MSDDEKIDEFGLIAEWLAPLADNPTAMRLSDDAAQLIVPDGQALVISTDMLVAGVHFPIDGDAALVARRMLACNISDLAAKGAKPYGCFLNLGVAENWDTAFLKDFVATLGAGLEKYDMQLWGGDTVRAAQGFAGLTVHGLLPEGEMLTRRGAHDGDDIYVTGTIGDGFLALPSLGAAYADPQPPIDFGQAVRCVATSAIDISDGLLADLEHICRASQGGMTIEADLIPLSTDGRAHDNLQDLVTGGDDLQIAFTAPSAEADALRALAERHATKLSRIGSFKKGATPCVILQAADGRDIALDIDPDKRGFRHF